MVSNCLAKVVYSDVRHNFLLHYLAAIVALAVTPVIFGLSELNEKMAAQPLEIMSPIFGMILMTPIFLPEQNESISDVVRSKKTSHILVCFLRLLCSLLLTIALVGILALYMRYNDSKVTARLFAGAIGGALALGSLGFFSSAVCDNAVTGYMVSASYLLMNMILREKLWIFDMFSFSEGKTEINSWLYLSALVLIILALLFRKYIKRT